MAVRYDLNQSFETPRIPFREASFYLIICFYSLSLTFIDVLIPFVIQGFCSTLSPFLETVFNGVCLSSHLLKRQRKISKPKFTLLFWVAYDQPVHALDITYKFNFIEVFEVAIGYLFFSYYISSS